MDQDNEIDSSFGVRMNTPSLQGFDEDDSGALIGSTSDYVLIAMIIAMMFCMTLCCLCLFCRSSPRLTICGINFELNERGSVGAEDNQSEIHEVIPLTPATAGDYANRLPDIETMLKGEAPPMYNDLIKKTEANSSDDNLKGDETKDSSKVAKKKSPSESSSTKSNRGRRSWRFSGSGLLASFRAKSSILRSRRSDSATQCPTVEEGVALETCEGDEELPPLLKLSPRSRAENREEVTLETVNEVINETKNVEKPVKMFVYDADDLPPDDDDVFL